MGPVVASESEKSSLIQMSRTIHGPEPPCGGGDFTAIPEQEKISSNSSP